ncbi:hypothetical protein BV20DRAFT_905682, partial [Pilatotrama ljubarskyi]
VYLVGVIPGPTKPSTEQINHFLAILVDELLEFWNPGVNYTRTAKATYGRLVRAALIPLVCDLPAARQVAGLGAHNHVHVLCSCCTLSQDDIETTDTTKFTPRSANAHRVAAEAWRQASSSLEREQLFRRNGIRYSELLRLPYWNPVVYVVVDSMHDLYLGILQRHIRDFWGINAPPRPSASVMEIGVDRLLYGSDAELRACGKAVLYHLCLDRGLRRAGTISLLLRNLRNWRKKEHLPKPRLADSPATMTQVSAVEASHHEVPTSVDQEEVRRAAVLLRKTTSLKYFTSKTRRDVLVEMCIARGLGTTGAKTLLAQQLWSKEVSGSTIPYHRLLNSSTHPSASTEVHRRQQFQSPEHHVQMSPHLNGQQVDLEARALFGGAALGRETMSAYLQDRTRIELPRWVNPAPIAFGTSKHGKLSADQWRTVALIHLPTTLIRTWGTESGRRLDMLKNFLDIVDAIETLGLLEIDDQRIVHAQQQLVKYLEGVKVLYKGAKFQPTHHLALHLELFLRLFGPVHAWRSFAFERINFMLQSVNTNLKFGELEMTMMMHSCRSANLRPLLSAPAVRSAMPVFVHELERLSTEERRGMRMDEIRRLLPSVAPGEARKHPQVPLTDSTLFALLSRLNSECSMRYFIANDTGESGTHELSRRARIVTKVDISGVFYKPWTTSLGDSNIIFQHPYTRQQGAGRIEQIFKHTRAVADGSALEETFIVAKQLKELEAHHAANDPYRRFGRIGGRLCQAEYHSELLILKPEEVLCHFAKTMMDDFPLGSARHSAGSGEASEVEEIGQLVHVRPLDRV